MVTTLVALMINAAPIAADAPENTSLVPSSTSSGISAPSASFEVTQSVSRGSAAWQVGGVVGGVFMVGSALVPAAVALEGHNNTALAITVPIAGAIAGGIGGWFLGGVARDTTWGKVAVIVIDVLASLGVSALVGTAVVAGASAAALSGFGG